MANVYGLDALEQPVITTANLPAATTDRNGRLGTISVQKAGKRSGELQFSDRYGFA